MGCTFEKPDIDEIILVEWDKAKDHLRARLQPAKSKLYEVEYRRPQVFRSAKEYMLDDLIIVPYLLFDFGGGIGTTMVQEEMLNVWNKSPREVIDLAMENTKKECRIYDLDQTVRELAPELMEGIDETREQINGEPPIRLICTNELRMYGAIAGILMQEELIRFFGTGYTLIPSSVHEMIAINRNAYEAATRMVKEVNYECLAEKEVLSDHAYRIW